MARVDDGLRVLFHNNLRKFGAHCTTIETGNSTLGVPDSHICIEGIDLWIEHKRAYANCVRLSVEQVGWISYRKRVGGRVFVAVRKRRKASARLKDCDDLYIFDGRDAEVLKEEGLKKVMPIGLWGGGPRKWLWTEIVELLTSKK